MVGERVEAREEAVLQMEAEFAQLNLRKQVSYR